MFKIVCAWCKKTLKEGSKGAPVTHLICQPCYEKQMRLLEEERTQAAQTNRAKVTRHRKPPTAK